MSRGSTSISTTRRNGCDQMYNFFICVACFLSESVRAGAPPRHPLARFLGVPSVFLLPGLAGVILYAPWKDRCLLALHRRAGCSFCGVVDGSGKFAEIYYSVIGRRSCAGRPFASLCLFSPGVGAPAHRAACRAARGLYVWTGASVEGAGLLGIPKRRLGVSHGISHNT